MADIGKIPAVFHDGAAASGPTKCAVVGTAKASATGIINGDAAVAISHAVTMQAARTGPDARGAGPPVARAEAMKEFVGAIREKIAKLMELFEQIATGRFSGGNLAKSLKEQAEAINRSLDVLWENAMISPTSAIATPPTGQGHGAHTDTGQALSAFKEELEQTNSSDKFVVGLNESTKHFNTPEDVEQNMAEVNTNLELGMFSLARTREQAMKALRCENLEPDRVLFLLQNP